jgi:hypothetical protein
MSIVENSRKGGENSKFDYNFKVLLGLQKIADNTQAVAGLGTLINSLIQAVKDHQEFELKLVRDIDSGDIIVQRNEYDEETGNWTITYVDASGAAYTPGGSGVEYIDPEEVLLSTVGQDGVAHITPNQKGQRVMGTDGTTDRQLKTDSDGHAQVDVLTSPNLSSASDSVEVLQDIHDDLQCNANIQVNDTDVSPTNPVPVVITPLTPPAVNTSYYLRSLGAGTAIPAGAKKISIMNIGNDNVNVTTDSSPLTILDPGIRLEWVAEEGKTLGGFTFGNTSASSLYVVTQVR